MAASQQNITANTPMGANLIEGGATFRVWAPNAYGVYVVFDLSVEPTEPPTAPAQLLAKNADADNHWTGFFPGLQQGRLYQFFVVGESGQMPKRDPYARALTPDYPWKCILETPDFPWHDAQFVTPAFSDLVIYQLHIGSFYTPQWPTGGTFLDVAAKVPYLAALGITAIQPLPIQEFNTETSEGYNGVDYFSPEMSYAVDAANLPAYLIQVNGLLQAKGLAPYLLSDIQGAAGQLRAMVDICHCYGIAVLFDMVYNHAGPGLDNQSLLFFDLQDPTPGFVNSLYFTSQDYIGQVFDYSKPEVRNFLINSAKFFIAEYHADGFRYDEISMLNNLGQPNGWSFCQDLTSTVKFIKPQALNHAEYWQSEFWIAKSQVVVPPSQGGAGFDTTLTDQLRVAIRDVIGNASQPNDNALNMDGLVNALWENGFSQEWQIVQGPENHDLTYAGANGATRIAHLSDPSNSRSWYGRSRSRVATGICLTAPGIPMLFMGQEFLEDKLWSDNITTQNYLPYWGGLNSGDKQMTDHLRFTSELIALRWQYPALRGQGFSAVHSNNNDRVCAWHRWVPDEGKDVMVVVHLGNSNTYNYRIGFPWGGTWKEAFNSDVYENWVNPNVCGNGGWVTMDSQPYDGQGYSAALTLPANSILVLAR